MRRRKSSQSTPGRSPPRLATAKVLSISAIVFGVATFVGWYWFAGATPVFAMLLAITVVVAGTEMAAPSYSALPFSLE